MAIQRVRRTGVTGFNIYSLFSRRPSDRSSFLMLYHAFATSVKLAGPVALVCVVMAAAQSRPQLPCGQEAFPAYPDVASPPVVTYWSRATSVRRGRHRPARDGPAEAIRRWSPTVGRFRGPGSVEELLQRIGAVSRMTGMRYWSTTHQRWQDSDRRGACGRRPPPRSPAVIFTRRTEGRDGGVLRAVGQPGGQGDLSHCISRKRRRTGS